MRIKDSPLGFYFKGGNALLLKLLMLILLTLNKKKKCSSLLGSTIERRAPLEDGSRAVLH